MERLELREYMVSYMYRIRFIGVSSGLFFYTVQSTVLIVHCFPSRRSRYHSRSFVSSSYDDVRSTSGYRTGVATRIVRSWLERCK